MGGNKVGHFTANSKHISVNSVSDTSLNKNASVFQKRNVQRTNQGGNKMLLKGASVAHQTNSLMSDGDDSDYERSVEQLEVEIESSFPQSQREENDRSVTPSSRTSSIRTAYSLLSKTSQGIQFIIGRSQTLHWLRQPEAQQARREIAEQQPKGANPSSAEAATYGATLGDSS